MSVLTQLENKYHFSYPVIYKTLEQDNMLDWLRGWNEPWTKERNWFTQVYPKLKEHPPLLLHNNDFELMPLADISDCMDNPPEYWDPKHRFIPFGVSGAGDWYAFYDNLREGDQVPVALVFHDMDEVQLLAANFNDFIFLQLIEITQSITEEDATHEAAFKNKLQLQLHTHKRYLSDEKVQLIELIYSKPVNLYTHHSAGSGEPYHEYGILTSEQVATLLNEQIGGPLLDHTFSFHVR